MNSRTARNTMLAVFKTVWDSTGYVVKYDDVPGSVPTTEVPWSRVTVRHMDGGQRGFGNSSRLYEAKGTLTVQVFAPIGDGNKKAYDLAYSVMKAFRDAKTSVMFRNHRIREVGNSGAFEQINVLIDFSYDDS
jgi:hypothetical protein